MTKILFCLIATVLICGCEQLSNKPDLYTHDKRIESLEHRVSALEMWRDEFPSDTMAVPVDTTAQE